MKKAVGLVLICVLTSTARAETNMDSVMFKAPDQTANNLTRLPAGQQSDRGERCQTLAREIEKLKGKPQRRNALSEQYRAECEISR